MRGRDAPYPLVGAVGLFHFSPWTCITEGHPWNTVQVVDHFVHGELQLIPLTRDLHDLFMLPVLETGISISREHASY